MSGDRVVEAGQVRLEGDLGRDTSKGKNPSARFRGATEEPVWIRYGLIFITISFLVFFLFLPLLSVFTRHS